MHTRLRRAFREWEAMEAESTERRRKPLSDATNHVVPTASVLRKLSSSLSSPPSKPIHKPKPKPYNANSKPYGSSKAKPDNANNNPSKSDNTSIGSSTYNPITPTRASVAHSGNRSEELFESIVVYKRRETAVKTKEKGKAVDGPLTSSFLRNTKDSENSDAMPFSPLLQKTKDKRQSVDAPFYCSSVDKRRDKGKAIDVSFSHHGKTKHNGKAVSVPDAFPSLVNTRNKSKGFDIPFSCPPLTRTKKICRTEINGVGDVGLSKLHTVPPPNKKKRRCVLGEQDVKTHDLPQEFVERQRAYFKDVDDFELAEEEISESELDNEEEKKKSYNHESR